MKKDIVEKEKLSWKFVVRRTQSEDQNFEADDRGWQKGKTRTRTDGDKQLVKKIRNELEKSDEDLYVGPKAILKRINKNEKYKNKNFNIPFIARTLKELKLSKPNKKRKKGGSEYLHYPKYLISEIGETILEIDFIQRFIKGQTKPLSFLAFSCKQLNLKQYRRISAQTNINIQKELKWFFKQFFIPDAIKMDNGLAFIGSNSAKRTISKTVKFLFSKKIIPIFTNPRSPWNNGSVEGSNSVFARNFWNKFIFKSIKEIDGKLKWFNKSSLEYSDYDEKNIKQDKDKKFIPQIFFIRKIYANEKTEQGEINILNEKIILPEAYINLYTLSMWNLKTQMLYIYFEKEQNKILIKKLKFQINKNCQFQSLLSFDN